VIQLASTQGFEVYPTASIGSSQEKGASPFAWSWGLVVVAVDNDP
jgi:hypothetical protein